MWWDNYDKEQLPFGIRGGLSFKIPGSSVIAFDLEKKYYRDENPGPDETVTHLGLEQALGKALKIRLGTYSPDFNNQDETSFTFGLGFESNGYKLSLAAEKYKITGCDVDRYVLGLDIPI